MRGKPEMKGKPLMGAKPPHVRGLLTAGARPLAGLAIVMNVMDSLTTYIGLKTYPAVVSEANPLLSGAFAAYGLIPPLLALGALYTGLVLLIYYYPRFFNARYRTLPYFRFGWLALLAGLKVTAVVNNLYVLMRV